MNNPINCCTSNSKTINITDVQIGDVVLNVGIVKQIYPDKANNVVHIEFNPRKELSIKRATYRWDDTLTILK